MKNYYYIQLRSDNGLNLSEVENYLLDNYNSTGIEDFNINEARVDEILGKRSYSGGDLPLEVLQEVESVLDQAGEIFKNIHFDNLENAKEAQVYLRSITDDRQGFEIVKIDNEDWNEEWKKSYSPICVGELLDIIPQWDTDYVSKAHNKIYIYPGMGFGTGSHETTFLCLRILIEKINLTNLESCLDYGCGSGILGLALNIIHKQKWTDYYDIDQEALDNTKQNIDLNNVDHNYRLLLTKERKLLKDKYDIVFANILQDVLLSEAQEITSKTSKYLIVSGLLNGQEDEVIEAYQSISKLAVNTIERKGDWLAILFVRES